MSKPQTRAESLGVSPARIARSTKARADKICTLLEEISSAWGEVDNAVCLEVDSLLAAMSEFEKTIAQSLEYLKEPRD